MRGRAALLAGSLALCLAGTAHADSIVFERDGNVWLAEPDGSGQVQVTTAGGYAKPTQSDDGTIVAVKGGLLHRMDRGGRFLNTAGTRTAFDDGPITPAFSPSGSLVAYNYFNSSGNAQGFHTTLSFADRETGHDEIWQLSSWFNPSWIGNDRVLMFDSTTSALNDTVIKRVDNSPSELWYDDPDLNLSGGEISPAGDRFAATDGQKIRLYRLSAPPPAQPEPRCDLVGPTGSFFRPSWSPDGSALAWQEGDGIHVGRFDLETCQGDGPLVIPGGLAPDWGPANVPARQPDTGPPITPGDTTAAALGATIPKRVKRRTLKRGLKVPATCNEACSVTADLLVDKRTARRLKLGKRRIGRASKTLAAAGSATLRLKPNARARKRLARIKAVTVSVGATDAAGNRSTPVKKKVALR